MACSNMIHYDSPDSIENAFRRLTIPMRMFGILYYSPDPNTTNGLPSATRNRKLEITSKLIHAILGFILWLNVIRYFCAYDKSDSLNVGLMRKISVHVYFVETAAAFSTCTNACRLWKHVFREWHVYRMEHAVTDAVLVNTRKRVTIGVIAWGLCFGLGTAVLILLIYFVFYPSSEKYFDTFRVMLEPLPKYVENTRHLEIAIAVVNVFFATVLSLPVCFIICICLTLRDEFRDFNNHFRIGMNCKQSPALHESFELSATSTIEFYRRWHLRIVSIVELCDNWFSVFTLLCFVCNIPLICTFLYATVFAASLPEVIASHIGGMLIIVTFLFAYIYVGTVLNEEATKAKSTLYTLHLDEPGTTPQFALQYSTFLGRLNAGHIGITGWRLFHIDKMTLKVVTLMVTSYTFILLKFGSSDSKDTCLLNGAVFTNDVIAQCLLNCTFA